jgi:hypothetical protein
MKRVFICSPYAGDIEGNTGIAKILCRLAIDAGYAPFVPHLLYPQVLDEKNTIERALGISTGLNFMDCCDSVWAYIANGITEGMKLELAHAKYLNKEINYLKSINNILERNDYLEEY